MSFYIDDDKLLEKYKTISSKIGDLQNIEMNALAIYDERYIKTITRAYDNKVQTNFRGFNVPQVNLLQSFLSILYLFMETNIIYEYI